MKKYTILLFLVFVLALPVYSEEKEDISEVITLYPIYTQFAEMKNGLYATFDSSYDHAWRSDAGPGNRFRAKQNLGLRYTFLDRIRIGTSSSLIAGQIDNPGFKNRGFGLGNTFVTTEVKLIDGLNLFFNNEFPTLSHYFLEKNSRYSFQTGLEFQKKFMISESDIVLFSNVGYQFVNGKVTSFNFNPFPLKFDFGTSNTHGIIHKTAFVWDRHKKVNPMLEVLGQHNFLDNSLTVYIGNISGKGTRSAYNHNITLVPGVIIPVTKDRDTQVRVGIPVSLITTKNDFYPGLGVSVGLFKDF